MDDQIFCCLYPETMKCSMFRSNIEKIRIFVADIRMLFTEQPNLLAKKLISDIAISKYMHELNRKFALDEVC